MSNLRVGADRNLKIVRRGSWDGSAAKQRIFSWAGWPKNPDPSKAKRAFFLYDASAPKLMGSYHDPFADVVNGELVAVDAGITAAASRLPQTDAPESEIKAAIAVKDAYMKKLHKSKSETEEDVNITELMITKASLDTDGTMRWAATVSKFDADEQLDEVTREFYEKAAQYVEDGEYPMPALVVSHYDDSRISAIQTGVPDMFKAGETTALYIDRNQPKAKGVFSPTPLGKALYEAVRHDLNDKTIPDGERIRISMSFRPDYNIPGAVEKSDTGVIKYKSGHIRHFAATRVPIVKETQLIVEKANQRVTKFEDASSIVGPELAAELDENYKGIMSVQKSDVSDEGLIEKASTDMKNNMGDCIKMVMDEGKPRKQAIAICLSKMRSKSGIEDDDILLEKNMPSAMDMFDHEACVREYTSKSWSIAASSAMCDRQAMKLAKANMEEKMAEKAELSDKDKEILEKAAIAIRDNDVNALVRLVIPGDDVKIVEDGTGSGVNTANDPLSKSEEAVVEKSDESVNPEQVATPAEEETTVNSDTTGQSQTEKSEADAGVNEAAVVASEPTDSVATLMNIYKAALDNTAMGRAEKSAIITESLQQLAAYAQERIREVPPSAADQAELLKAAISEAVSPLISEVEALKRENADMRTVMKNGVTDMIFKPAPKQISAPVQKSNVVEDNGGAMTSSQIAERTVR